MMLIDTCSHHAGERRRDGGDREAVDCPAQKGRDTAMTVADDVEPLRSGGVEGAGMERERWGEGFLSARGCAT